MSLSLKLENQQNINYILRSVAIVQKSTLAGKEFYISDCIQELQTFVYRVILVGVSIRHSIVNTLITFTRKIMSIKRQTIQDSHFKLNNFTANTNEVTTQ